MKSKPLPQQWVFVGLALGLIVLVLGLPGSASAQEPSGDIGAQALMGTGFTYQGQLQNAGSPVTGTCDFRFSLWNNLSGGSQLGATQTKPGVSVTAGLFTLANLDFGAGVFTGAARWLQIAVRCPAGSGSYTSLSPRQALTPAPYALALPGLWTQQNAVSPNLIGGNSGNSVDSGVVGATIGGGGDSDARNRITDDFGTVGGGWGNRAGNNAGTTSDALAATIGGGRWNTASGGYATVGGGYLNTASSYNATVGGGERNIADYNATVGGGADNTASGYYATVGGGADNTASNYFATVGGGSAITASGEYATVGGGRSNIASGYIATVGGGRSNTTSGNSATVGGGYLNTASNYASTVGGGWDNSASGNSATVGGGWDNSASGQYATVGGGIDNAASGDFSFAAGWRARANNRGCFVWGDATNADVSCNNDNRWVARAGGGVYFYTNSNLTSGVYVPAGGSAWSTVSDRRLKEHFEPVDGRDILARLADLPLTTWNYKSQEASIRHIGPMAQDFYAAFRVGEDDTHISTLDADGVALAASQGLYQLVQTQQAQIARLEARLAALEAQSPQATSNLPLPGWVLVGVTLGAGGWLLAQQRRNRGER